jgi:hypothetical protein
VRDDLHLLREFIRPMRASRIFFSALALVGSTAGCNAVRETPSTSHHGTMIALPGDRGFFEVKTEAAGKEAPRSRSKTAQTCLVVYFYQNDGNTELNPAPTDVTVQVGGGESSRVVPLTAHGKPGEGFASSPGNFPSGFRGRLSAKLDGNPIETTFLVR